MDIAGISLPQSKVVSPENPASFAYLSALESVLSQVFLIKEIEFSQNG